MREAAVEARLVSRREAGADPRAAHAAIQVTVLTTRYSSTQRLALQWKERSSCMQFSGTETRTEKGRREREAEQERRSERLPLVTHSQCQSVSALSLCLSAAGVYDYWHTTTTKTEEFQSGRWRGSCVEHAARAGDPRAAQEPHLLTHFASDQ